MSFCEDLQQALPALPMLEDMTPGADRGDIKVLRGNRYAVVTERAQ